jgi:hypothetical protein
MHLLTSLYQRDRGFKEERQRFDRNGGQDLTVIFKEIRE